MRVMSRGGAREERRRGRARVAALVATAALAGAIAVRPARPALEPGGELSQENWQDAQGLLPEEFLACYRRGDFRHSIGDWGIERVGDDPVFREALDANRGRYDLAADGSIVDARTGEPPEYVYAWPFPDIERADPKAGTKIVWNYFYTMYYGGNGRYRADLQWLSRRGRDRAIEVDELHKFYDGQHPRLRERDRAAELLSQTLAEVRSPADVADIVSLSWRYRTAGQRDAVWAFVPALRRVRQVSPANRSDGFLGSDMTQDDGFYFDGKVQDFTWRLIGEQDLLVLFDRPSFEEPPRLLDLPGGGYRMFTPVRPRLGFELPDWRGVTWCPIQEILIRRPHWVVEAVPKDPYYLHGKLVLRFDKDIYLGSYTSKYDWQGNLVASYSAVRTNIIKVGPGELWGWAGGAVALALNWKLDRATSAGIVAGEGVPADSRIPLDASLFSLERIARMGK